MSLPKYTPEGFALQIFKDRYAIHLDETFEEACGRVSRYIADAEIGEKRNKYYEQFFNILSTNRFSPGGRTWRGSGRPKGQLLNCFHKETPVVCRRGIIPIKDIIIGDEVLTIDGTFKKVVNHFSQGKKEKLLNIQIDRMPNDILMVTNDHEIYTQNGWKKAEDIKEGDYVYTPGYNDKDNIPKNINVMDFLTIEKDNLFIEDNLIYKHNSLKRWIKNGKNKPRGINKTITPVKATIEINIDLMKLLGYYLSEGCAESHGDTLIWTFGKDEINYVNECKQLAENIFGKGVHIKEYTPNNPDHPDWSGWYQVRLNSRIAHNFMLNWIGDAFNTKKIPWWFLNLPEEYLLTLIGYSCRGDGCHNIESNSNLLTMCNPTLMTQLFIMGNKLEISYSLKTSKTREDRYSVPYSILFSKQCSINNNFQKFLNILNGSKPFDLDIHKWKRVEGIKEIYYNDEVFDISVEENHTLQVMGIVCKNCFVIEDEIDHREGWGETLRNVIIISGTEGGVGINFSKVRPRGAEIRGTGGHSTGSVSLMRMINAACEELRAGGSRRSALMFCLNWNHPDIPEFLEVKLDKGQLNNANISVCIDDDFLKLLDKEEDIVFKWHGKEFSKIKSTDLWDKIVANSLKSGDPGILNIGFANKQNNIYYIEELISTNPCGEIWLSPFDCCCLGSIILSTHISENEINWDMLDETIHLAVRFLDNVLTQNHFPLKEIERVCNNHRRIGLGIMGLHDMVLKLGFKYDSKESYQIIDKIMEFIKKRAYEASIFLSLEKGQFPSLDREAFIKSGFCKSSLPPYLKRRILQHGIRNCALLNVPPTGTTSIVAGCSSGIEPMFAPVYRRNFNRHKINSNQREKDFEIVIAPLLAEFIKANKNISHFQGSHEISPESHIKMQIICQKHIDNAISKTINLPNDFESKELSSLIRKNIENLKGITVYREGSKGESPLMALELKDAKKYIDKCKLEATDNSCPNGKCDL